MSDWWALMWDVKPGSEEAVQELFKSYQSPDPVVKDEEGNEKGKLLRTVVFMKGQTIVRAVEIEGALPEVAAHLGRQPEIQDLEEKLDPHLALPRDMSDPEGARRFFMESIMQTLVVKQLDE
jgi:SchA/CurD like domain